MVRICVALALKWKILEKNENFYHEPARTNANFCFDMSSSSSKLSYFEV